MQKIVTFLWFNDNAEEAVTFYTSLFKNSKINAITHYGEGMPMPRGTVLTVSYQLAGQEFLALNGGPYFKFNEAMSLMVQCESQEEIDELWERLSAGGEKSQCGWLKDKYGVSWQITPAVLGKMMRDKDPRKTQRVMQALMPMQKIDIKTLERAYQGT